MKRQILFSLLFGTALALGANVVQAQNAESYESLMRKGNEKFNAKDFISAKTYYEMALKQKSGDPTAKQKLTETVKKIQEDGARQEVFYAHLDAGDQYYSQQKYEEALTEYEAALKVFPEDKYVGGQASAVRAILQERQDKQDAYDLAMSQGEALLAEDNFDAAIMQFETAKGIFPNDKLPKEKIAEAKQKKQLYTEKVARFDNLMEEARQFGLRKNYEAAIGKLDQALELFPDDERLVLNTRELDCTTYVDVVVALTLCHRRGETTFAQYVHQLHQQRYWDGKCDGYPSRIHYFSDWIRDNSRLGYASEVQAPRPPFSAIQTVKVNYMTQHPKQYVSLDRHPEYLPTIARQERELTGKKFRYIPTAQLLNTETVRGAVHDGDIIGIVTQAPGLDIAHLGIAVWHDDGLHMIDASSLQKKVVEETITLKQYLQRRKNALGIRVIRLK